MPNNFDTSSTGTNIEAVAYWDTDISQYEFKENFEILQYSGYRTSTVAYYIDNGNVKGADDIDFALDAKTTDLVAYAKQNLYGYESLIAISGNDLEKLKEEVIDVYGERLSLLNFEDFNKVFEKYNIAVKPSKTVESLVTKGYSQGDYARVFFCPEDLEAAWGTPRHEFMAELQSIFDHLFWDAPIYACMTVNGEDYHYEGDRYDFERDSFLKQVAEQSGATYEALDAVLPKEPSYT